MISHPNYHGAEKVSLYIGKLLRDRYHVPAFKDLSFDKSREVYEHRVKNLDLQEMTDAYQYLNRINDPDMTLDSFIIANTHHSEVRHWQGGETIEGFNRNHVYFQKEQKSQYVNLMLRSILGDTSNHQ